MLAPTLQKREGGAKGEKGRGETGRKNARGGNTEKKRKSQVSGKWKRKGLEEREERGNGGSGWETGKNGGEKDSDTDTLINAISQLKLGQAAGPDGVCVEVFQFDGHRLAVYLTLLFNMCRPYVVWYFT